MNTPFRALAFAALALILLLSGFAGGLAASRAITGAGALPNVAVSSDDPLASQLREVRGILDREALKAPSETSATAGAIQGLLDSSGDKYAAYFDEKHFAFFSEQTMGSFGGIGVSLGEKSGSAYVVEVYPNTPAKKVGIKAGDVFVSIDGVTRAKWTTDEVVKRVRGKEGTKVKIAMKRPGKSKPIAFVVKRAMIDFPNITGKTYGDIGYVRMASFNAKSAQELRAQIEKQQKKGAKGLILDLRDNPGGLLSSAVDVTSLFLKDGVVVRVEARGEEPVEYRASRSKVTDLPLVVLLNGNSASASEITGGALQDTRRAVLIGEKSFGKGSVQSIEELSEGGAIKFTSAHYLTPKGRAIDGKGLQPDIKVKMDHQKQADPKADVQLQRALEYLRDRM